MHQVQQLRPTKVTAVALPWRFQRSQEIILHCHVVKMLELEL